MRQLLGVVGPSNALSHCHMFVAKLQGLMESMHELLHLDVLLDSLLVSLASNIHS